MDIRWLLLCGLTIGMALFSAYQATHCSINFGTLSVYFITVALGVWCLLYRQVNAFLLTLPGKILLGVLGAGALCAGGILTFILISAQSHLPTGREKAMVVLGAGLRGDRPSRLLCCRLDAAAQHWREHPELVIVTTGGVGVGETIPEGLAMKRYLVEKGVPENQILSEEASVSTEENLLFAKELLAERGITANDPMVVVTNAFHCYRGRKYAEMAGFTAVTALPAAIPPTAVLSCYLRETAAVVYYWCFRSSRTGFLRPLVGLISLNKNLFYHR